MVYSVFCSQFDTNLDPIHGPKTVTSNFYMFRKNSTVQIASRIMNKNLIMTRWNSLLIHTDSVRGNINLFCFMLRTVTYPYKYIDNYKKLTETSISMKYVFYMLIGTETHFHVTVEMFILFQNLQKHRFLCLNLSQHYISSKTFHIVSFSYICYFSC